MISHIGSRSHPIRRSKGILDSHPSRQMGPERYMHLGLGQAVSHEPSHSTLPSSNISFRSPFESQNRHRWTATIDARNIWTVFWVRRWGNWFEGEARGVSKASPDGVWTILSRPRRLLHPCPCYYLNYEIPSRTSNPPTLEHYNIDSRKEVLNATLGNMVAA